MTAIPVYGLAGAMHGGGKTLTLMSASGSAALCKRLKPLADIQLVCYPGNLPLIVEKRLGGLQQVINALDVEVLQKPQWDRKKSTLGDSIYQ